MPNQRRGSVPCESNVVVRNYVGGKHRNPKSILRRRSSSGTEILAPLEDEPMVSSSSNDAEEYLSSSRLKKDPIIPIKRRGSLPIEVIGVGLGKDIYFDSLVWFEDNIP